jgi:hypothetical protein
VRWRLALSCITVVALGVIARDARAVDLPKVANDPVKLDVTETAIVAQRFEAREGEQAENQGYFAFLNRLNAVLGWRKLTFGIRLDSSLYFLRPEDRDFGDPQLNNNVRIDGASRYRNAVYPAKLWLSYKDRGIEVTAGDSYVQFGRGLVLSMRKVDELGIDTTLFGGKVSFQKDPFGATVIAGLANPARVDEPSGRALFPYDVRPRPAGITGYDPRLPLYGSDRIIGAQIQGGRGLPVIASTHVVRLTKCSPYRFNDDGFIVDDPFDAPIGTCDDADRSAWLASLPVQGPILRNRETTVAGQSIEVPSLWGHGSFYVEAAVQKREPERVNDANTQGNAVYGSLTSTGGPISNTLEVKSYRDFYPLAAGVNASRASAFSNIAYSFLPTTEPAIADTMFGFYNACVTGGRDRLDYRFTPTFLAYGTFGYWHTKSEILGGTCDRLGRSTGARPSETTNYIKDASVGVEWRFDDDKSIVFANLNGRHDVLENDTPYYREGAIQYSLTKYIKGPYSIELAGRHRYRIQDRENEDEPWWQGEHQNALKVAPKWVVSQGYEYTTLAGFPTHYLNGSILYRFTSDSNVRIFVGQNRGGLRCVSGVCRFFPAFSGARIELTLRF